MSFSNILTFAVLTNNRISKADAVEEKWFMNKQEESF